MINKEQITEFTTTANRNILQEFRKNSQGIVSQFPLTVTPNAYEPFDIHKDVELQIEYMTLVSAYLVALDGKPNSNGKIINLQAQIYSANIF